MRLALFAVSILICINSFSQERFITIDSTKIWINTIGIENRKEGQAVIVFERTFYIFDSQEEG